MGRVKGCVNEECITHLKNIKYKETENFCSKCGVGLVQVCKGHNCYTFLEENDGKYCVRCQAKRDDNKDKVKKAATYVGGMAVAAGGCAVKSGKNVIKNISKLKQAII